MRNILRHLSSLIAPLVMGFVLPYLIVRYESWGFSRPLIVAPLGLRIFGGLAALGGLFLFTAIIRLFIRTGQGTIMPWDPSRRMVTAGLYAHVRNPMIMSVLLVQAGTALLIASGGIALLALLFFAVNWLYFVFSEEPGLEKRFGDAYREYKKNVPRWIPRIKPWRPAADREDPDQAG
jgi:protein-S-isoprenylcysteine O-methyltransferase Ste14